MNVSGPGSDTKLMLTKGLIAFTFYLFCVCAYAHYMVQAWRSEDSYEELVLSSHLAGVED